MSSGWARRLALITELARLPQSMRGGPGHHGPVSDHFDGARFFNPGAGGRSLLRRFSALAAHPAARRRGHKPGRLPAPAPVTAALEAR